MVRPAYDLARPASIFVRVTLVFLRGRSHFNDVTSPTERTSCNVAALRCIVAKLGRKSAGRGVDFLLPLCFLTRFLLIKSLIYLKFLFFADSTSIPSRRPNLD